MSSSIAPTRFVVGSHTIADPELTAADRAALLALARCALVIGRHGLLVKRGQAQAVLLPQVATEQRLGPEAFLNAVCHKAGLAPSSWRDPATQVFTFTADVFGE